MKSHYRHQEVKEFCFCGELQKGQCARCQRPLCEKHEHAELARCQSCENEYNDGVLVVFEKREKLLKRLTNIQVLKLVFMFPVIAIAFHWAFCVPPLIWIACFWFYSNQRNSLTTQKERGVFLEEQNNWNDF